VARPHIGSTPTWFDASRYCLLAVAGLAPVVMTRLIGALPLTHDAFELPKMIVVRVLLAAALVLWAISVRREDRPVRLSWWLAAVGLYVAWTALATAFSDAPAVSLVGGHGRLDGLLTVVTYGLLGFLAMQLFTSASHLVQLARTLTISGLIVGLYGAGQNFGFHPFYQLGTSEFTAERVFASMGNPVFLGGLLVLLVPIETTLALADARRSWRIAGWVAVIVSMVALVGTATRASWLVGLFEIALLLVILVRKRVRIPRSAMVGAGIGAAVGTAVVVRSLRAADQVMNVALRFASIFRGDGGSATERFFVMRAAVDATRARPVLGWGPGRFEVAFQRFRPAGHVEAFPRNSLDNAHNMLLQISATAGIVAAVAWAVSVIWPLAQTACGAFSRDAEPKRLIFSGFWLGAVGYALFLMAGISVVGSSSIFWMVLGVLAGLRVRGTERSPGAWFSAIPWLLGVVLAVTAVWGATAFAADNRYMLARERVRGDAPGDPMEATLAALRLAPRDYTYLEHVVLLTEGVDPAAAKQAALNALAVEPQDLMTMLLLVQTHVQLGELDQAVQVLQEAKEAAPLNPDVAAWEEKLSTQTH